MGVVNVKSGAITNRDATPRVTSNANLTKNKVKEAIGKVESAVDDLTGSKYRFCSIPSNAVLNEILLYMDIMDSGATTFAIDVGLYDTTENGGLVVSQALFASAVLGLVTAINGTKIGHEANDIANGEKMIWQLLSLSADPCKMYDVVATTTGDNDTAGTILLKVRYKQ